MINIGLGLIILTIAWVFVDITAGKPPSNKMKKVYLIMLSTGLFLMIIGAIIEGAF